MRIAYVTETFPPEVNGVALTTSRTVDLLRQAGHHVQVLRPRQAGEAACDDEREWRTPGSPLPLYPGLQFGWATPRAVRQRLAGAEVGLVHLATPGPLAWAALRAAGAMGLPATSDFRTNFHQYAGHYGLRRCGPWLLRGLRAFHNRCGCTFVPTRQTREELAHRGFDRLAVLGRGVDTALFHPGRRDAALRAAWGADERTPLLLHVGRLAAEKNVALALQSFEDLRATGSPARMVVVGDGPLRAPLARAHPTVRFVGMLSGTALAAAYASADLFVFPSVTETFGNVTLEALASGLAVVAFRTGAAAEHIRHGLNGILAAAGDDAGFRRAVCRHAPHCVELRALRDEAARTARALAWERVNARFERRLHQVVEDYASSGGGRRRAA
ncbi:MAG: glycosyltransferase family 1 protein [Burkholderiaceae bacterium]